MPQSGKRDSRKDAKGAKDDVQRELFCRLLKKIQRQGARKIDERRRTKPVRWSETIERNEAYESFSAAGY